MKKFSLSDNLIITTASFFTNTYTSHIKSATQDVFTVEGIPETVTYGDRFEVQTAGAQEGGTITYTVSGVGVDGNPADIAKLETVDGKTYIEITGMGTVTVKATSSLANYNDKSAMRTFAVGKKTLAVKATPVARTYDGTTAVDVVVELDGVTENNVTSDNEATINEVIAELNEFTPENEEEQKQHKEALDKCNSLLAKIEAARKALGEAEEESAVLDKERATVFWENDIKEFLNKINSLLENPNMNPAEIEKLKDYKTQAEEILEIIRIPKEYISLRFFYLIWDCFTWAYEGIGLVFSNLFS